MKVYQDIFETKPLSERLSEIRLPNGSIVIAQICGISCYFSYNTGIFYYHETSVRARLHQRKGISNIYEYLV